MTFNKRLWGDYERLIGECHDLAGNVGAVPSYGMGPHSPSLIAKNPSMLSSMANRALSEGKRKVDAHRGQCIQNSVNEWVNTSPLMRLPVNPLPGAGGINAQPTRPTSTQFFSIFIRPINIPELDFLDDAIRYCGKRTMYLRKLSAASQKWDEWTNEVARYYKTGVVNDNDADLTALERTENGSGRQIKRNYLVAYFTELKNTGLFSNNNETTKAMEDIKNRLATAGASNVRDVVGSAERNNFSGATASLNRRADEFLTSQSSIQSYRNELSAYISASSSCSATVNFNPITGNYRVGG